MHLYWYGQTCFKLQENGITVAIDPYKIKAGKSPRMAADIILLSNNDLQEAASSVSGDAFLIDNPGEYEVKGIFVNGIGGNGKSGQTFFYLDIFGLKVGHLGRIQKGQLNDKQLEMFENVDILLVPVGGEDSVNAKEAADLVNQIEPKIVVPMYYSIPQLKVKLDGLDTFKKALGVKTETMDKLLIKQKDIPQDEMKMIIIEPQI